MTVQAFIASVLAAFLGLSLGYILSITIGFVQESYEKQAVLLKVAAVIVAAIMPYLIGRSFSGEKLKSKVEELKDALGRQRRQQTVDNMIYRQLIVMRELSRVISELNVTANESGGLNSERIAGCINSYLRHANRQMADHYIDVNSMQTESAAWVSEYDRLYLDNTKLVSSWIAMEMGASRPIVTAEMEKAAERATPISQGADQQASLTSGIEKADEEENHG